MHKEVELQRVLAELILDVLRGTSSLRKLQRNWPHQSSDIGILAVGFYISTLRPQLLTGRLRLVDRENIQIRAQLRRCAAFLVSGRSYEWPHAGIIVDARANLADERRNAAMFAAGDMQTSLFI